MKRWMRSVMLLTLLLGTSPVLAHGTKDHVMGTITAVEGTRLTVQTREGKTLSIRLTDDTKYWRNDAPAKRADLKNGSRMVADVTGSAEDPTASEVRVSTGAKKNDEKGTHGEHREEPHGGH